MRSNKNSLKIYRGDLEAGFLKRAANGCVFEYAREFLENPRFDGLSYKMPKSQSPIAVEGTNLHPFFAGLLPEGLRLRALVRSVKTSEDDLFSLFAAAGANVVGDVYAQKPERQGKSTPAPKLKEIDFYDYFETLLNEGTYAIGEDAISGVQEKISASMISFPLNIAKATKAYILKLNPEDKPNLVQNERWCLTLAGRCGLDVPKAKLVKDRNGNAGLLVERFDRRWDAARGGFQMIHQEDACQFLNRYPADKYNLSFREIAEGVRQLATAPRVSSLKLLRLYCYSYLIGNGDLHAKNISLLADPETGTIDLTPAYDLVATSLYGDRRMALLFEGKNDNVTRQMAIRFGARLDLPEATTAAMLDRLTKQVRTNLPLLARIPAEPKRMKDLTKLVEKRISDLSAD